MTQQALGSPFGEGRVAYTLHVRAFTAGRSEHTEDELVRVHRQARP